MSAESKEELPETIPVLVHKLRNTLSPLKTFLDMIRIPQEETRLVEFHQICVNNFERVLEIINKIETK